MQPYGDCWAHLRQVQLLGEGAGCKGRLSNNQLYHKVAAGSWQAPQRDGLGGVLAEAARALERLAGLQQAKAAADAAAAGHTADLQAPAEGMSSPELVSAGQQAGPTNCSGACHAVPAGIGVARV